MVWGGVISAAGSIIGGALANRSRENIAEDNAQLQREFAQNGISWKVADAKRAGIHPLYALGNNGIAFQPTHAFGDEWGSAVADASQHIGRAIDSTQSTSARTAERLNALTVERGELENEVLRARLALLEQQKNPPMPVPKPVQAIPGQSDVDDKTPLGLTVTGADAHAQIKPQEVTPAHPHANYMEPAPVTDMGLAWTGTGYAPVPSKDVKDRSEDMMIPEVMWGVRNFLLPNLGQGNPPPASLLPPGKNNWRWSYSKQEWQPVFDPHRARVQNRRGHHGPDQP